MVEITSSVSFVTTIINWITGAILWFVNLFSGGIVSIGSISIVLIVLLLASIWAYQNQEKLAQYF